MPPLAESDRDHLPLVSPLPLGIQPPIRLPTPLADGPCCVYSTPNHEAPMRLVALRLILSGQHSDTHARAAPCCLWPSLNVTISSNIASPLPSLSCTA